MLDQDDASRMIEEHTLEVYRCCLGMLRDCQLAEDASQETFLRALRRLSGFRQQSSERTWLLAIAINVCRDMLRKPYYRRVQPMAEVATAKPRELLAQVDERDGLVMAIQSLPDKQRAAVLLHYYCDLTVLEIAHVLHISRGTVSTHLMRARRVLYERLAEEGGVHNETQ